MARAGPLARAEKWAFEWIVSGRGLLKYVCRHSGYASDLISFRVLYL